MLGHQLGQLLIFDDNPPPEVVHDGQVCPRLVALELAPGSLVEQGEELALKCADDGGGGAGSGEKQNVDEDLKKKQIHTVLSIH